MSKLNSSYKSKALFTFGAIALLTMSACVTSSSNATSGGSLPQMRVKVANPLSPSTAASGTNVSSATAASTSSIVDHGLYRSVVAGSGDTIATLAAKASVTPAQLAKHNSIPETFRPSAGQEFAIPTAEAIAAMGATDSFSTSTVPADTVDTITVDGDTTASSNNSSHRVAAGETAYSIARLYGVSVTALSSWNNLGPDLSVREGQELIIPKGETPNVETASTAATTTTSTSTSSSGFQKPVSGSVATGFDPANNSDGVVYSTGEKASVVASSAGTVVLVSESTGANGTIVMVQHPNGLISVYGKLGNAIVTKGQSVSAGQTIGTTAGTQMLFQLRKGTEAVNPNDYV